MDLLHHGVDRSVIALWLEHESVKSTQMYVHTDMRFKEKAFARTAPLGVDQARYRPCDKLLSFFKASDYADSEHYSSSSQPMTPVSSRHYRQSGM
jgi:hypothetical protein